MPFFICVCFRRGRRRGGRRWRWRRRIRIGTGKSTNWKASTTRWTRCRWQGWQERRRWCRWCCQSRHTRRMQTTIEKMSRKHFTSPTSHTPHTYTQSMWFFCQFNYNWFFEHLLLIILLFFTPLSFQIFCYFFFLFFFFVYPNVQKNIWISNQIVRLDYINNNHKNVKKNCNQYWVFAKTHYSFVKIGKLFF